jgi:small-conductance mechanosensitive channel
VVYDTAAASLRRIPGLVKGVVESTEGTRFDRTHFQSFGDFSLNFEVVYYVLDPDYNIYMDRQQTICLKIFEVFQQEKIEFAYPSQTLFLKGEETKN